MSFTVRAKCSKCVHKNGDFTIHSWIPIGDTKELRLSRYLTFSTKGENAYLSIEREYDLELEEVSYDPKFGGTYKIISCPNLEEIDIDNLTFEESMEILLECTSSPTIAQNILSAYPNYISLVLKEGKDVINTKLIKGVGEVYNSAYVRDLNAKFKYYKCLSEYKCYKLDISDCKALYEVYNDYEKIVKVMNENPYTCLCNVMKKSFDYADKLILQERPELKLSDQRCEFAILDVLLRNETDKSTRINGNIVYSILKDEYNVSELLPLVRPVCEKSNLIYYNEELKYLSIMDTYMAECFISNFVKERINNSNVLNIDWKKYSTPNGIKMTEKQSYSLYNLCNYKFSLLVGYSGSGKTTSVNGLIALCEDNGLTYTLVAPTGKASLRMKESTKRRASTIHRKVLCDKEITTDVLIVDESSMIDLATFVMLLQAVTDDNTRVVLVGDNAQLLPVGLGCVFNNIIESEVVPMTMLTDIFRYDSSGALFVATNTRNGKPFFDSDELDSNGKPIVTYKNNTYKVGDNYSFIETEDIFGELTKTYMGLINKGVKPDEILCLSPYNVGDVGTYAINSAIQAEINPPKANENIKDRKINQTSIVFRNGDRILNKQNDYKAIPLDVWEQIQNDETKVLSPDDFELLSIFNGQDGKIVDIDDKKLVAQFDEDLIVFDRMKINSLLLGYCISVHASQGSEAKYVINVVSKEHKNLNKNMLYVADTRAKYKHWDIGSTSAYNEALLIDGNELRDTWLLDLLTMKNVA